MGYTIQDSEKHRESIEKELKIYWSRYRRGMLTFDEWEKEFRNIFNKETSVQRKDIDFKLKITEDNWTDFLDDYDNWKKGMDFFSKSESHWLKTYCNSKKDYSDASVQEKSLFFTEMDYFLIPTEYYEPVPSSMYRPHYHSRFYNAYTHFSVHGFVDDGGLIGDKDPIGKTFTLTHQYGLKAEVTIQGVDVQGGNGYVYDYLALGTIEGFTPAQPREIWIEIGQKEIACMGYYVSHFDGGWDDASSLYDFPLWQEYFQFVSKKNDLWEESTKRFMDKILEKFNRTSED